MVMDEIPGGFWRAVAEGFIQSQLNKPFLGRPYLKLGQCLGIWSYLFEVGGVLGAKHAAKTDAFVSAFLGQSGPSGAAKCFLVEVASQMPQAHSLARICHITDDFSRRRESTDLKAALAVPFF